MSRSYHHGGHSQEDKSKGSCMRGDEELKQRVSPKATGKSKTPLQVNSSTKSVDVPMSASVALTLE